MNASSTRATVAPTPHTKAMEEKEAGEEEESAIEAGCLSWKGKPELMGLVHFPLV